MATIESRLATLEQVQRKALPELVLIYPDAQEGEPTPTQQVQIEMAERQGRPVRTITITRAEDAPRLKPS